MADMAMATAERGHQHPVRLGGGPRGERLDGREACEIRGVVAGQCRAGGLPAPSVPGAVQAVEAGLSVK